MTAVPFPLAPIIGEVFRGFAYNGRSWVQSRGAEWSNVQVFTASGRYEPSENLIYAIIECFGAGGGGGWTQNSGQVTPKAAAGGGGSGGYSRKTLPAELVIQGADVVIGLGGIVSVGTAGGGMTATDTDFGGLCVAHGGGDAYAFDGTASVSAVGSPGRGAAPGIGDIHLPGTPGGFPTMALVMQGSSTNVQGVNGGLGGTLLGGNVLPTATGGPNLIYGNYNGADGAANSGSGGGGGASNSEPGGQMRFGGRGGSGLVVVTEICGTENGGGGGGGGGTGWPFPPGVEPKVNLKARVTKDGCCG